MSVRAMTWAWDQQCPTPTAKLVLLKLADRSNDEGECWPSQARIAEDCGISRQTANTQIKALSALGLIEARTQFDKRGQQVNLYFLRCQNPLQGCQNNGHPLSEIPTPPVKKPDTESIIEPKKERIPLKSPKGDDGFEDFWQVYPKKVGKQDALKAWPKALKADNPQIIIEGARRYASDHPADWDYWKNPSGWLNGKRWLDQPLTNGALLNGYSGPSQPLTDAQREEIIRRTHGS